MTIKRLVSPERYIGLSNDDKPTGVRSGATYYAYDTYLMYITYDGTNWVTKVDAVTRAKAGLLNSGVLTADTAIKSSAGAVYWLTVSDTATLAIELNNSTGGSGTDLWALSLPASGYAHFIFDPPIEFSTGIYLDVSTATCKVVVGYI